MMYITMRVRKVNLRRRLKVVLRLGTLITYHMRSKKSQVNARRPSRTKSPNCGHGVSKRSKRDDETS